MHGMFVLQTISLYVTKYSRMDQVKFVEDSLSKILRDMVCCRLYLFKFFKGYFPQILLGSFLNTLPHVYSGLTC